MDVIWKALIIFIVVICLALVASIVLFVFPGQAYILIKQITPTYSLEIGAIGATATFLIVVRMGLSFFTPLLGVPIKSTTLPKIAVVGTTKNIMRKYEKSREENYSGLKELSK